MKAKRSLLEEQITSCLIGDLHDTFYDVAARRPPNRYDAHFTDDPTNFLRARDDAATQPL